MTIHGMNDRNVLMLRQVFINTRQNTLKESKKRKAVFVQISGDFGIQLNLPSVNVSTKLFCSPFVGLNHNSWRDGKSERGSYFATGSPSSRGVH